MTVMHGRARAYPLISLRKAQHLETRTQPAVSLDVMPIIECPVELREAQRKWDHFYQQAWSRLSDPNPELRRDRAVDKTLRALGRRPRGPLTLEEQEDLHLRAEVEQHFADESRPRNFGNQKATSRRFE